MKLNGHERAKSCTRIAATGAKISDRQREAGSPASFPSRIKKKLKTKEICQIIPKVKSIKNILLS
jgi:hypothetical protein